MGLIVGHVILMVFLAVIKGEPCTKYGCPGRPLYEPFVPAPPGHTPRCAKPGQTFCETLDHYPQQLIKFLVDKCSFDFSTVLRDESHDDFNAYSSHPDYHPGYEYQKQEIPRLYPQPLPFLPAQFPFEDHTTSAYRPATNESQHNGYKYLAPSETHRNPFLSEAEPLDKYQPRLQHINNPVFPQTQSLHSSAVPWTNRYVRSNKILPRTIYENPLLAYARTKTDRAKRQSKPDTISICPTRPQFITPKAALNNQGNWMYVVNLEERNDKYKQTVRSETCSTDQCNGLCSLPTGYTSSCQQQYVQKRLVALEGSGNRLYTDVFWFPHGCSCQVSLNYT